MERCRTTGRTGTTCRSRSSIPAVVGNIFYNTNGQNFLIKGVETSLVARVISGLTLQGAASWNQSRQTNSPVLIDNNPGEHQFRQADHAELRQHSARNCAAVTNPFGPDRRAERRMRRRSSSACARRYEWTIARLQALRSSRRHPHRPFIHAGGLESDRFAKLAGISTGRLRFENPAYTTFDASLGVAKDAWIVNVFGENLEQFERQHIHQHRSIHRRADTAAAADHRRVFQLQILRISRFCRVLAMHQRWAVLQFDAR